MEAFSIYSPVLTSHFPHRWKDLRQYKLLLLCTYQQFVNRVWLAYDRAFREHAATTNLTDWSNINVQFSISMQRAPSLVGMAKLLTIQQSLLGLDELSSCL